MNCSINSHGRQNGAVKIIGMKRLLAFIKKEFAHVLRDKKTLLILFGMPVVQVLLFGFVLTHEVKNVKTLIIDQSQDATSAKLISKIKANPYFKIEASTLNVRRVEQYFKKGNAKLAMVFPANFGREHAGLHRTKIQLIADASDPNYATTAENYLTAIVQDFNSEINWEADIRYTIQPEMRMLYNPELKGAPNFVPGVMALVLMIICVMMTAISIAKEKETGTMEILLLSPIKPFWIIVSKIIPHLVLSVIDVISILLLSVFVLDIPIKGSVLLLMAESTLFVVNCLSLGIFISVETSSQQAAMLISLMGMLLPTILLSGFMFPIENMPEVLQWGSNLLPAKWFYIIVKAIVIKGLGFPAIWKETLILLAITASLLGISLKRFKIRLE